MNLKLVADWRDWKSWWSLRLTALAGMFTAMGGAASLHPHSPWWFPAVCAGLAFLCNGASGTARVISQTPKDGNPPN